MAYYLSDGWRSCPEPSLVEPEERTFCEWDEEPQGICPVCGKECDFFVLDRLDGVIGCDRCTRQVSAWDHVNG